MKLLLTSAGLSNDTIVSALETLSGAPLQSKKLAFIPTAANVEPGEKDWLIDDYVNCRKAGLSVDIVDISALRKDQWLPRVEACNLILCGGGNTFHLRYWLEKSGLETEFSRLLKDRVYVGISAGSCVTGTTIYNPVQNLFGEHYEIEMQDGLAWVPFQFVPHLNSRYFPHIREEKIKKAAQSMNNTVYALDDASAVVVNGKSVTVVSEGQWLKIK